MLVYAIDDSESFASLTRWRDDFIRSAGPPDGDAGSFPFAVVGNKSDVADGRKVPQVRARGWCEANLPNACFFEASAKTAENVDEAFMALARAAVEMRGTQGAPTIPTVAIGSQDVAGDKGGKGGCC